MMQIPLKRTLWGGACLLIMLAPGWAAVYHGNFTIRPGQPTGIWSRTLQPMDTANLSIKVIKKEGRYQLKSGPTSHPATGQYSVWSLTGTSDASNSKTYNYTVLNCSPQESSTQVRVTCIWEPITGTGGGGGGTRPDDIPGFATGTAHMAIGQISWDLLPNQRHAGPSGPIAYTVRVVNEHNNLINTNTFAFSLSSMNVTPASIWQIWPSSGPGPSLGGDVTSESGSVGYLRLQYNYFGHLKTSISPRLTFVSIENMQYQKDGAWINVPDMIYSCLGSNLNFRVTPRPSFAAWPPFKPVWSGATGSGGTASATHVLPGVYNVTAECGNTVNAQVTIIKVDTIETYCDKFGASGSFGVNPEIFPGGEWDFGQPDQPPPYWWLPGTYANPSSRVLKVFFKYIKDSNDEPAPFDIDLKANILPDSIDDAVLNITWQNWAGPSSSGSFDKTDEREVKFQNPTKGGLYKFRMEMELQPYHVITSDAWVLLPKAGGEIADWIVTEVPSLVTRASDWESDVRAVAAAHSLDGDEFLETAWIAIASYDFDYQGIVGSPTKRYSFRDADRPVGHVPDPSIPGMVGEKGNGDWDEPSYTTLRGIVVHRAKVNNAMYAVWGRELGYTTAGLRAGAFWNAAGRGLWDDSTSQNAVTLGGDLYDAQAGGGSLSALLTKTRAKAIQSPDTPTGLNDVNLWPDPTPVSSGFVLPTMPRDYDSLIVGTNETVRGRLFN